MTQEQTPSQSQDVSSETSSSVDSVSVTLGVDIDPETEALLRSLDMPSEPPKSELESNVPLSGVLRRPPKARPKSDAVAAVESPAAPINEVIGYQPIAFETPWESMAAEESEPASALPPKAEVELNAELDASQAAELPSASEVDDPTPAGPIHIKPSSSAKRDEENEADELEDDELQEVDEGPAPPPALKPPPRPLRPPPAPPARRDEDDEGAAGGKLDEGRDLDHTAFPDNGWYNEAFGDDFFRTLPKNFHKHTLREVNFVIDRLGIEPGARVLDLACGFGRHTMIMSKMGYEMVGLDLSMTLLQKALSEAQRRNLSIKFIHGDMRKLAFANVFDGVFNLQTSFGFFNDQTNFRVLQGIYRALKPGGRLVLETVNRDFVCAELPLRVWWEGTECLILEEVDFDYLLGMLKVKRSFVFEDSSRDPMEQTITLRLYSASEMRALLMRAGFKVRELSGDYTLPGAFFGTTSRLTIFVAERPIE
ncbi:MAG: methyltransferase domain-containing protein [Myxococcota bacterium]|jgi:SAM-dependent methyltransferase|nr:methyltransferase domain-containing protein [Myxococcota bacterium]